MRLAQHTQRVLRFVLGSVLLTSTTFGAQLSDLSGWSGTRWGMSPAQIKKVHPEMTIGAGQFGFTAGRVPDMTIAEATFKIYLQFAGVGGMRRADHSEPEPPEAEWKLARVELHGPLDACYRVNEGLLAKYGQPTKIDGNLSLWVMPTTTVRLIKSGLEPDCEIIYHPTEKGDGL